MTVTESELAPAPQWQVSVDDYVHVLQIHPDRSQAVVGSLGGEAALVATEDGSLTPLEHHEMGVLSASWSADGTLVAVGGQDGRVRIYDRAGVAQAMVELADWVTCLAWSPTASMLAIGAGRRLLIVDNDGSVLYDFDDQASTVTGVAWSPDGSRVGAAAYDGVAWHDVAGKRAGRRRRFAFKGSLLALAISPDGKWACAGAQDATVQLWKLWSGKDLAMSGYPSKIERLQFRHDSRWLAMACLGELSIWDFGGRGPARTRPATGDGHEKHIEDLAWDPSGETIATAGADGRTIVWAAPNRAGETLQPVTALESDSSTSRLGWLNERSLLVGRADGGIVRIDFEQRSAAS